MHFALYFVCVALSSFLPSAAHAATYTVGPSGRDYTQLSTLVDSVNLEPGDMVLVDGGTTYNGDIIVRSGDRGAPGNPVTFRWNRSVGSTRPVLRGGTHTIKRSEEHTSELQSLMRISYAVFCLKKNMTSQCTPTQSFL